MGVKWACGITADQTFNKANVFIFHENVLIAWNWKPARTSKQNTGRQLADHHSLKSTTPAQLNAKHIILQDGFVWRTLSSELTFTLFKTHIYLIYWSLRTRHKAEQKNQQAETYIYVIIVLFYLFLFYKPFKSNILSSLRTKNTC